MTFLSTPSARRATKTLQLPVAVDIISIHALREEGDIICSLSLFQDGNFYPRPPRGGRLSDVLQLRTSDLFLSTPSARRATTTEKCVRLHRSISIHALREEGDADHVLNQMQGKKFLSTPSARRATAKTEKNISAFVSV